MTDTASAGTSGAVTGGPRTVLRLEGLALFIGMTLLYYIWDGDWWIYAVLFFVPDLSFAAYLSGPRFGALVYNAVHSYLAPVAMMTGGFATAEPLILSIAMIWLAHIGFDRALGYGLKYASGFGVTHLGRIGKPSKASRRINSGELDADLRRLAPDDGAAPRLGLHFHQQAEAVGNRGQVRRLDRRAGRRNVADGAGQMLSGEADLGRPPDVAARGPSLVGAGLAGSVFRPARPSQA